MRIFLAGGSGAIGTRLVPQLVARGHQVTASTRTQAKMDSLRNAGADPVIMDGLNKESVMKSVVLARPEVVVHELTALTTMQSFKHFDQEFAITNRLRTEGTEYLLKGAVAAGAKKFVAQSYAGWPSAREGGRVKTEEDPFDSNPPAAMSQTLKAFRQLESMALGEPSISGVVLRYGSFYGPGTSTDSSGKLTDAVRQRQFPLVGDAAGVWSFIHIDDAASATRIAIEIAAPGIYNIVDDDPAEVSVWLPELAKAVGAKPPRHVPEWLARLLVGEAGVSMMTKVRGASNAKARRMLNWQPGYRSWRDGFHRGFSAALASPRVVSAA